MIGESSKTFLVTCLIILVFIGTFISICAWFNRLQWARTAHSSGKYCDYNPYDAYNQLVDKYGTPDVYDPRTGGFAVWYRTTLKSKGHIWDRIEIHDEQVPHTVPTPHVDYMYTWFKMDIPENKRNIILSMSDSITYDPLKKLIRARCHFEGANIATIWLAMQVVQEEKLGTPEEYKAAIMSTVDNIDNEDYDPLAIDRYINDLKNN
jgi:hypothetical protein